MGNWTGRTKGRTERNGTDIVVGRRSKAIEMRGWEGERKRGYEFRWHGEARMRLQWHCVPGSSVRSSPATRLARFSRPSRESRGTLGILAIATASSTALSTNRAPNYRGFHEKSTCSQSIPICFLFFFFVFLLLKYLYTGIEEEHVQFHENGKWIWR